MKINIWTQAPQLALLLLQRFAYQALTIVPSPYGLKQKPFDTLCIKGLFAWLTAIGNSRFYGKADLLPFVV